jgi:hypothetical protein
MGVKSPRPSPPPQSGEGEALELGLTSLAWPKPGNRQEAGRGGYRLRLKKANGR